MLPKINQKKMDRQMLLNISTAGERRATSFPANLPILSDDKTSEDKRGTSMIYEDKVAISSLCILVVLGLIVSLIW